MIKNCTFASLIYIWIDNWKSWIFVGKIFKSDVKNEETDEIKPRFLNKKVKELTLIKGFMKPSENSELLVYCACLVLSD